MGGTGALRVVLKNLAGGSTDRIVLHAAQLQIDSVRVNGIGLHGHHRLSRGGDRACGTFRHALFAPARHWTVRIDYRRLARREAAGGAVGILLLQRFSRHPCTPRIHDVRTLRCPVLDALSR